MMSLFDFFRRICKKEGGRLYEPRDVTSHLAMVARMIKALLKKKKKKKAKKFWMGARLAQTRNNKEL